MPVVFKVATAENVARFYDGESPPKSMKGFVAELDGEIVGVGGIYYDGPTSFAFTEIKPAFRKRKKDLVRGIHLLEAFYNNLGFPVMAIASLGEPTAPALLKKLGWVPTGIVTEKGEVLLRG